MILNLSFFSLFLGNILLGTTASAPKTYDCAYDAKAPFGVLAWHESERVRNGLGKESRFENYDSSAAEGLVADATAQRTFEKKADASDRTTSFYQAYNEKGWYIYIESTEPLIDALLDDVIDPKSPALNESYEIFFTPGLEGVPYYQIFTRPFAGATDFYDWATSSRDYRSLKDFAKIESLPLPNGVGTFLFIPWEALYEHIPIEGGDWRFTIIRWMPYGKAGGVTWGGKVHETGQFGMVRFLKPDSAQKLAMERRLLRYGWFKFQADVRELSEYWNDPEIGDPSFYEKQVRPVIERITASALPPESLASLTSQEAAQAFSRLDDLMELPYLVSSLREEFLINKRFTESK